MWSGRGGRVVGSVGSAFLVTVLLCVSSPASSSKLENPIGETRPRGLLEHTIIRAYGAIVPGVQDYNLENPGWGTGFAVSYGFARAVQASLELAYYGLQPSVDASFPEVSNPTRSRVVRQASISVGVQSPARSWLRPWFGLGFGIYDITETEEGYYNNNFYQTFSSGSQLGINWGLGVSARLDQRLAVDLGGRYHFGFGPPFLETPDYWQDWTLRLFSVQAGLSYAVR